MRSVESVSRAERRGSDLAPGAPAHRRVGPVLLVAVGGSLGAGSRLVLAESLTGSANGWPMATLVVNLLGAFGLGFLLQTLLRGGPEGRGRRSLRLGLGTGFFGGFTTYSGFALDTLVLAGFAPDGVGIFSNLAQHLAAAPFPALGYVTLSLAGGLAAAFTGVLLASWCSGARTGGWLRGRS